MIYLRNKEVVNREIYLKSRKRCIKEAIKVEEGTTTSTVCVHGCNLNEEVFTTRCLMKRDIWMEFNKIRFHKVQKEKRELYK